MIELQLRKLYTTINIEREENVKQYKTRLTELEQKIENLEERFIEEKINRELYEKFAHKFSREKIELLEHLRPTIINTSNLEKYVELATIRVTEPASMWTSSNYAENKGYNSEYFLMESIITRKRINLEPKK